jgi:hypothetical protein
MYLRKEEFMKFGDLLKVIKRNEYIKVFFKAFGHDVYIVNPASAFYERSDPDIFDMAVTCIEDRGSRITVYLEHKDDSAEQTDAIVKGGDRDEEI